MAQGTVTRGIGRVLLIGALLAAAALLRGPLESQRAEIVGSVEQEAARLRSLEGRATTVMLSGLRGPVVVGLWTAAEEEKNNEQWERLRTRYQMIAALQPHFSRVYEFNAWNLAYNISADQSDLVLRYQLIRSAIDFLLQGDRQIPNSAVINWELYWTYKDKLGSSQEADFYKRRFREETLPRDPDAGSADSGEPHLVPLILTDGTMNPAHRHYGPLERIRPVRFPEIPSLDQPLPEPIDGVFPYGMSVFAASYNFAERTLDCPEHPSKSTYMVQSGVTGSASKWSEHVEQWADEAVGNWIRWLPNRRHLAGAPTEADFLKAEFLLDRAMRLAELSLWRHVWMVAMENRGRVPEQIPWRLRHLGVWPADARRPAGDDPRYRRHWMLPPLTREVIKIHLRNLEKGLWRRFALSSALAELRTWWALRAGGESRQKALAELRRSATLAGRARGLLVAYMRDGYGKWLPVRSDRMAGLLLDEQDVSLRRYLRLQKVSTEVWDYFSQMANAHRRLGARRRRIAAWLAAM